MYLFLYICLNFKTINIMYENEKIKSDSVTENTNEKFAKEIYNHLLGFNLNEQNEILRYLYEKVKEERNQKLCELKIESESIEISLKELFNT